MACADTLLSSWTVCLPWQDTVKYIIEVDHQRFYISHPCLSVDYMGDIDPALQWLIPSAKELATFDDDLANAQRVLDDMPSTRFEMAFHYFPVRLTQCV